MRKKWAKALEELEEIGLHAIVSIVAIVSVRIVGWVLLVLYPHDERFRWVIELIEQTWLVAMIAVLCYRVLKSVARGPRNGASLEVFFAICA